MAKAFGLFLVLAVALAIAAGAAVLMPAGTAGAQAAECRDAGVVPGSVEVVSSNNLAGEVSGHTIRFQICLEPESAARSIGNGVEVARPVEIGLLWDDLFRLDRPEQAGITLTATGDGKSWNASDAFAKRDCRFYMAGKGASIGFARDELNDLLPPDKNAPVALQFYIPEAAEMLNPTFPYDYRWRIVLRYDRGGQWETYTESAVAEVIPRILSAAASISISPTYGPPASYVRVAGHGFPPLSPVQRVQVGSKDVTPDNPAATDAQGKFQLETFIPGVESGRQILLVQVNGITSTTLITVTNNSELWVLGSPVEEGLANLGDNLVRAFQFNWDIESWTFYDPEIPEVSTLSYLIAGGCYWILVKEPMEVILNRETRTLTCQPDGNCWNIIVW